MEDMNLLPRINNTTTIYTAFNIVSTIISALNVLTGPHSNSMKWVYHYSHVSDRETEHREVS